MTNLTISQDNKTELETGTMPSECRHLHLSSSPHLRNSQTIPNIMKNVIIGLIPASLAAIIIFRFDALILICLSITTAVLTEWAVCLIRKSPNTLKDYSAIVTGLLFALTLPPLTPWWMVVLGSAFAIGIVKMVFGGLGKNYLNPALAGCALLMILFPTIMNASWKIPAWGTISGTDSLSSATPLANLKEIIQGGTIDSFDFPNNILHLFIGNVGGSLGVSGFALLLGTLWLLYKKIIGIKIPLSYLLTFFILCWIFNGTGELFTTTAFLIPAFHLLAGGLILGAFFMANDKVTSPITSTGKVIFGIGCGLLTFIFRKYTNLSEGVCFSILIMNLFVPILEKYTKPRVFKKAN